eukprot:9502405-Pyramimonas_sp.AAC.1
MESALGPLDGGGAVAAADAIRTAPEHCWITYGLEGPDAVGSIVVPVDGVDMHVSESAMMKQHGGGLF